MAVCDEIPSLTVKVIVAGKDAAEFDDEDGPQEDKNEANALNRVFRFIESEDNAVFSVHCSVDSVYKFESKKHRLSFSVYVDGQCIDVRLIDRSSRAWNCKGNPRRKDNGVWELHPFKFASITTVDNMEAARVKKDLKAAKSVGLIQVRVYRCKIRGSSRESKSNRNAKSGSCELAEKAVKGKAVSHALSFGSAVRMKGLNSYKVDYLDGCPFVTFNFKYRSRESLQKLMVIPRTPTPDPEEEINNLSEEAIRELALQQLRRNRASSTDTIKVENGTVIKREVGEVYDLTIDTPQNGRKRKRVETIDLTDD